MIEVTRLSKIGGPLTKRISLTPDGRLASDGSACVMSRGRAERVVLNDLGDFAGMIEHLASNEAIALGSLRGDLPDCVDVTTQEQLAKMNGTPPRGLIARTSDHIAYQPGRQGLALIDIDTKGMPAEVETRIRDAGGFWGALVRVLPTLADTARVVRRSTTTGIVRDDTGESLSGSNGRHIYLLVRDGADVDRFLRALHERCWLAGFGWHMVGVGGQLLDRSIVDRMVGAPERLVFEGAPVLIWPLIQAKGGRKAEVYPGGALDTLAECPPLRIAETAKLHDLKARSSHALAPRRAEARERFIAERTEQLAQREDITPHDARRTIERQCDGILLPDLVLPWDSEELAGCTVAEVLADPNRFVGATLADPLEGVSYGRSKGKVMRRADGSPWINSFAHGRTVYELRHDARAVKAAIAAAPPDQVADVYVRIARNADLAADQDEALRNLAAERSGVGRRALDAKFKAAKQDRAASQKREDQARKAVERSDPRPQIPTPAPDAPWLPQMRVLNDVLGGSGAAEPPMRDVDGTVTQVRVRRIPRMHALTPQGSNECENGAELPPAPEQPLLTRLDEAALAELIEQHIDYIDQEGRSVHLATQFVKHFQSRDDNALPVVATVATLPLVLPDGSLLAKRGLDRQRGIVFRVRPDLLAVIPQPEECTPDAVAEAMAFVADEWLCDVSSDYTGKATLIAAALTIIERSVLPERPAFFVTAGRRGGGKTTALSMVLMAVTGVRPSAAAWSPDEGERRKALMAYLMEGLPAVVWDNIPRGTQISCPHIERSCTTDFYSDRRLGVSQTVAVSASVVHCFTGNNIGPRGDLASRSLQVRLEIDRADPENRLFRHADPIGWTETNRAEILRALFTILLGNPELRPGSNKPPETRFKTWWRLVGSAVEHAAREHNDRVGALVMDPDPNCRPAIFSFRDLFLHQEDDDEESASISEALEALDGEWPRAAAFKAADLAKRLNDTSDYQIDVAKERAATLREFLFEDARPDHVITAKALGKRLKKHLGNPVRVGDRTLCLRTPDKTAKTTVFYVEARP